MIFIIFISEYKILKWIKVIRFLLKSSMMAKKNLSYLLLLALVATHKLKMANKVNMLTKN